MKQKQLLRKALLLCALVAGTSAWADDVILTLNCATAASASGSTAMDATAIATFLNSAAGLSEAANKITCSEKTGDVYNGKGSGGGDIPQQCLKVGKASGGGGFTFTIPNNYDNVDIVEITCYGWKTSSSISINSGTAQTFTTAQVETTKSFELASGTKTISIAVTTSAVCITEIALKKKNANAVATPTISGNTPFLTSTEVSITCGTDGATIQYSTDNGTSWNNYSAPFTLTATSTVKAKATKSGMTASDIATKTFTKATPMTVAEAITAINALEDGGTIADQCVAGKISQIDSYNSTYKSITYWISDDGKTTSQLEVYSGKGLNGADFSALSDLNVGDEVTVYGTLKKFGTSPNTTPEFNQNSQLLSYANTGTAAPIITASNVTIDSEATSGEITYSISNPTSASLTAAVKEGDDWISNVQVDAANSKVTFSVTKNTGEQRIGYITLSYTGATNKDVKITQKASYGTATLPFTFDGGKADIATTDGLTQTGLGSDYGSSPKLKFDNTDDCVILKINEAPKAMTFDIKGNSFSKGSTSTFKVQTSADGTTYTDLATFTELGDTETKLYNLASTVRYIKWIYAAKGTDNGGNVAIGNINVFKTDATAPITLDAACTDGTSVYGTYSNTVAFVVPNNLTVSEVKVVEGKLSVENYTTGAIVPAKTGVLVSATAAGNYNVTLTNEAGTSKLGADNMLKATGSAGINASSMTNASASNTLFYRLTMHNGTKIGFWWGAANGAGFDLAAHKAYLAVPESAAGARTGFAFDEETTGVANVDANVNGNDNFYDLQGRRVAQPTKGMYIVNGKKLIIK